MSTKARPVRLMRSGDVASSYVPGIEDETIRVPFRA
jgi:hypothetical protein